MKRDFSTVITHLNGAAVTAGASDRGLSAALGRFKSLNPEGSAQLAALLRDEGMEPMTVAAVAADALVSPVDGDERDSLDGKVKRMRLALRICEGGVVDVSAEDIALIKERVNKRRPDALIPVRVADYLELEPAPVEGKRRNHKK